MTLEKVPFHVINASSSDPSYPPTNLNLYNSQVTGGWQSDRFCLFPQILKLELTQPIQMKRVQILLHHFKIPTRIEIFIQSKDDFKRIGYVSLQSNDVNGFRARELKSIHLDVMAKRIKLVLHRCHINALNMYNQVGIVAINLLGQREGQILDMPNALTHVLHNKSAVNQINSINVVDSVPDPINIEQDRSVIAAMAQVQMAKMEAVKTENYGKALQLKEVEKILSQDALVINNLRGNKIRAARAEDYETAQNINEELDLIKERLEAALKGAGIEFKLKEGTTRPIPKATKVENADDETKAGPRPIPSAKVNLDDIPTQGKNSPKKVTNTIDKIQNLEIGTQESDVISKARKSAANSNVPNFEAERVKSPRPTSSSDTSSEPVDIATDVAEEYADAVKIYGGRVASNITSNDFNLRENGLIAVLDSLKKDPSIGNTQQLLTATISILRIIETDSREKCYNLYCSIFQETLSFITKNEVYHDQFIDYCGACFPGLLSRLSDMNTHIRKVF